MSFLGIDVGTTGCKVAAFARDGSVLAVAYREYDASSPREGWAELDSVGVWEALRACIPEVCHAAASDPVEALAVSSLGEAVVPVSRDRRILGPSILNFDTRGEEFLSSLTAGMPAEELYRLNGNTLGNHLGLTKLLWIRKHAASLWEAADFFLGWSGFVSFMLGAEPHMDFSLANRSLLFDIREERWSERLLSWAGLDAAKLPRTVRSGEVVGTVSAEVARSLGLPPGVRIVSGGHDQCCNAVGSGVTEPGRAMYGMGTYLCIVPVFPAASVRDATSQRRRSMLELGVNTEHHAAPGRFVSFLYNQGGALVKWYRDTFASSERRQAARELRDPYPELFAELPPGPSPVLVLPHFTATGPPRFISDSAGVVTGLRLTTTRGEILKGLLEGMTYYLKEYLDSVAGVDIPVSDYRAVGGGSKSDAWIQLSADIMDRPFLRPRVTEAGALGAAILAAVGTGAFASVEEGSRAMVRVDREFLPDAARHSAYAERFERYREMEPLFHDFLRRSR